ncbi:hypothetical protein [Verrucomicrobium sp. BvORR106]|uniref:hypothetical protein n=1 Tax=Verrucomicrobium sp. BvORR106 TaxID=1403819 RepID=UPI002240F966|nr:hypothetical protein [Verrucomicrobium sp. BvORR106]
MPQAVDVPAVLSHRLEGKGQGAGLGCSLIAAIVLLGLGSSILFYGSTGADKRWLAWLVGGGMCFLGTLFIWSWITQLLAAGTTPTVVEVSDLPVRTGAPFKVALIQPGPAALRSVKVRVICREITSKVVTKHMGKGRAPRRQRSVDEKIRHEQLLADARELRVATGDTWHQIYDVTLPAGLPGTGLAQTPQVRWTVELTGKLYGMGRFYRIHELDVAEG